MVKTVVLGAGGFIGGWLTKRLLNDGHTVIAADIKPLVDW
jgi:nucleoside-diphosphate-sugar epimerase